MTTGNASQWQENIQNTSSGIDTLTGAVSGGKTAVKAASGDFAAGAVVDLATLLVLAGTPSDANTVASLMGRLTKIRDLLDATLTVQGTVTANAGTNLNTSALALESGGNLATVAARTPALGQATMANSQPVAFASDQTPKVSSTAAKSNVSGAASDTSLLAANANRKGALFHNDSTATLYLSYGDVAASTASYSVKIAADGYFELPPEPLFTGAIRGIWSAANGAVRVTELS